MWVRDRGAVCADVYCYYGGGGELAWGCVGVHGAGDGQDHAERWPWLGAGGRPQHAASLSGI